MTDNVAEIPLPDITGWLLTDARTGLEPAGFELRLVETGPPPRKAPAHKPGKPAAARPVRVPVFGEWRVLRYRLINEPEIVMELTVAREQLGEALTEPAGTATD